MIALFVFAIPVFIYAANWQIDPAHSSFQFKIRHLTVSNVKGDFSKLRGAVVIDDQDITHLKIEVVIDVMLVESLHGRHLFPTGTTPGCPEVEKDDSAF
jgi:polyisoprenoid-binding protein YceI